MNKRMITVHLVCIIGACLHLVCFANPARADILTTGDVDPADPATWNENTHARIGNTADGTLDITSDSDVLDYFGYIGNNPARWVRSRWMGQVQLGIVVLSSKSAAGC